MQVSNCGGDVNWECYQLTQDDNHRYALKEKHICGQYEVMWFKVEHVNPNRVFIRTQTSLYQNPYVTLIPTA